MRSGQYDKLIDLVTIIFGVMIAIAWDAAIVTTFITGDKSTVLLFTYALAVTVIGFAVIYAMGKLTRIK